MIEPITSVSVICIDIGSVIQYVLLIYEFTVPGFRPTQIICTTAVCHEISTCFVTLLSRNRGYEIPLIKSVNVITIEYQIIASPPDCWFWMFSYTPAFIRDSPILSFGKLIQSSLHFSLFYSSDFSLAYEKKCENISPISVGGRGLQPLQAGQKSVSLGQIFRKNNRKFGQKV